jgi:hypothetical protein
MGARYFIIRGGKASRYGAHECSSVFLCEIFTNYGCCSVMPNLVPPVTTVAMALDYKKRLQALDPSITYLMTLYLHESMINEPNIIKEAKKAGIAGVKVSTVPLRTGRLSGQALISSPVLPSRCHDELLLGSSQVSTRVFIPMHLCLNQIGLDP